MVVLVLGMALLGACGSGDAPRTPAPASTTPAAATSVPGTAVAATTATPDVTVGDATFVPVATTSPAPVVATATPPAPRGGASGIRGTVTIGPTCPVVRIDSPCPDRPFEATISIWRGTTKVAETRSAADGSFFVAIAPGTYRVVGESPASLPRGDEQSVTVAAGEEATVHLTYDSGIR